MKSLAGVSVLAAAVVLRRYPQGRMSSHKSTAEVENPTAAVSANCESTSPAPRAITAAAIIETTTVRMSSAPLFRLRSLDKLWMLFAAAQASQESAQPIQVKIDDGCRKQRQNL
jgi:hypothetical protein